MENSQERSHDRWARLRFAIIGPLLAAPPEPGELRKELVSLAAKTWRHPVTGAALNFGLSTIERWYYAAKAERLDPVGVLRRRVRKDAGGQPSLNPKLRAALRGQYQEHKSWSAQLHVDNLAVRVAQTPDLGPMPSYSTVRRYLKYQGLFRQPRKRRPESLGAQRAEERRENLEVRSYEAQYVNGLWHLDFHVGSRKIVTPEGAWVTPHLIGILDDHSRLACHLQWYLEENTETLVHGLSQAIQKRALPRALMTDNGGPMVAAETSQGLLNLGLVHETTLPYSPYQNAKQEVFWATVEGRLIAMLEGVDELTLETLNEATQAWAELEYNRAFHSEIGTEPLKRYLLDPNVGRNSPSSDELRLAFRMQSLRTQRKSDATVSIEGRRFEIPSRYRHLQRVLVRYARWDLRTVDMADPLTGATVCRLHPQDKTQNANGLRRKLDPISCEPTEAPKNGIAPLLKKLMADYASTGLPPAYLPMSTNSDDKEEIPQ